MLLLVHPLGLVIRRYFKSKFCPRISKIAIGVIGVFVRCNLTLTQYISKYHEVILKLEGLDNFQKFHGFICGLNKDYKDKVKSQYPKNLEQAIRDAQVYDDNIDKPTHAFTQGKNNVSS